MMDEKAYSRHPSEDLVDELDQEMNALLYAISHDMRAPLRSIDGFSQALLEDYSSVLDEIGRDFLKRIQNAGKLLDRYIETILRMSRETRGELLIETVDLSSMAEEILEDLKKAQPDRKSEIVIQENITAGADRRLIRIFLQKILDNAWKFTSKNDLTRIEFGTIPNSQSSILNSQSYFIRDNGAGFDMKYAGNRLFGLFQKMHSEGAFDGMGTGLATARRIINRHAGKIWAESEEGKGTTVYFELRIEN